MIRGRLVLAAACTMTLAACATTGAADVTADQVALAPLPTVGGVGVLPSTVAPEPEPVISVPVTRPVTEDGTTAELVGDKVIDNRLLVIGDSIMASTATRYSGLMCDSLVPLGWAVEVEAEPSRFIDFGNRVLDRVLDPVVGTEDDWDAAAVFLGSNYGRDQQRYEDELRVILYRLAPRPTLLYTVTEYRPAWAEVNETIHKLADEFDNVTVVDWEQTARYPGVLSGDGLHPTNTGRQVLVDLTASALGPAALGAGECLKSQFTDDSAVGRGSNSPASRPSGGSGGGGSGSGSTATTAAPRPTTGSTTVPSPSGGGGGHHRAELGPASTAPPTTAAPVTAAPPTAAPPTAPPPDRATSDCAAGHRAHPRRPHRSTVAPAGGDGSTGAAPPPGP